MPRDGSVRSSKEPSCPSGGSTLRHDAFHSPLKVLRPGTPTRPPTCSARLVTADALCCDGCVADLCILLVRETRASSPCRTQAEHSQRQGLRIAREHGHRAGACRCLPLSCASVGGLRRRRKAERSEARAAVAHALARHPYVSRAARCVRAGDSCVASGANRRLLRRVRLGVCVSMSVCASASACRRRRSSATAFTTSSCAQTA
eukprot:1909583-Pleurochrysis_carterae.AAC.3